MFLIFVRAWILLRLLSNMTRLIHLKMYGKKTKTKVSNAHKVIVNISKVYDRCGGLVVVQNKDMSR
jgi:hypothetical protein